jgi:hypothetical protein
MYRRHVIILHSRFNLNKKMDRFLIKKKVENVEPIVSVLHVIFCTNFRSEESFSTLFSVSLRSKNVINDGVS